MNNSMYTEAEMLSHIRRQTSNYTSHRAMADVMGISESMLSKILKGERSVSDEVAQFFGRKLVRLYVIPASPQAEPDKMREQEQPS